MGRRSHQAWESRSPLHEQACGNDHIEVHPPELLVETTRCNMSSVNEVITLDAIWVLVKARLNLVSRSMNMWRHLGVLVKAVGGLNLVSTVFLNRATFKTPFFRMPKPCAGCHR